jgi:hypothetical protein
VKGNDEVLILAFIIMIFIMVGVLCFIEDVAYNETRNSLIAIGIFIVVWIGIVQFNAHVLQTKLIEHSKTTNIVALQDNMTTQGSFSGVFFIGAGYVDEDLYYYYIEKTDDGLHIGPKVPANKAYIQKSDGQPHMTYIWEDRKGESVWKYHFLDAQTAVEKYIFYVPDTTVVTDFKVDLK